MKDFNPVELIRKKRNGNRLTRPEIEYLISSYTDGSIPDYQFSALLMAIQFRGLNNEETFHLTQAMLHSGKVLDLSGIKKPKIDKHSTGGVGDKVSLILAPLMACCGICVPMISGRGLGHTGGTLDKLESIPGFMTSLSRPRMTRQLKKIGIAFGAQTRDLVPADRIMYALRDVTATVESIPLISASIMSKKLAEDIDGLVLDVKFGSGAFMNTYRKARDLAETLIYIGKKANIKITALLTDMNNPLGGYIGNALEIMEVIESLKGHGPVDLMEVTLVLGEVMLKMAKVKGGKKLLLDKIASGDALKKFGEIIRHQGGDIRILEDYSRLPLARRAASIKAIKNGYVHNIDSRRIGMELIKLGGGRMKMEDRIDHSCGFRIYRKIGDHVRKGELLIEIYSDRKGRANAMLESLENSFTIKNSPCKHRRLIRDIIS